MRRAGHADPKPGWYCTLPMGHDGPCPLWPRWWRHPVEWWRCHVS